MLSAFSSQGKNEAGTPAELADTWESASKVALAAAASKVALAVARVLRRDGTFPKRELEDAREVGVPAVGVDVADRSPVGVKPVSNSCGPPDLRKPLGGIRLSQPMLKGDMQGRTSCVGEIQL